MCHSYLEIALSLLHSIHYVPSALQTSPHKHGFYLEPTPIRAYFPIRERCNTLDVMNNFTCNYDA